MTNNEQSPATKTYSVWADATSRVYQDVEASSPQEAYRLAEQNRDGWEFCSDAGDNEYALSEEVMDVATEEFIRVAESPAPTLWQASQRLYDALQNYLDVPDSELPEELVAAMNEMEAAWRKADGTQSEEPENNRDLETIADNALDAFWEVIARAFPEAKHGDLSPLTNLALAEASTAAIGEWISNNVPRKQHGNAA